MPPTFKRPPALPFTDSRLPVLPSDFSHDTFTLHARQTSDSGSFAAIPSTYGSASSSPPPGMVAGIVLGSVGGFLLVLFLIYSCLGFGPSLGVSSSRTEYTAASQSVLSFRTRRTAASASRHRGPRVTETYEVRTRERTSGSRAPPVVVPNPVVVEPTRVPPPPRVVPEEDSDEEDEIVVLEEHSPPRRKSRRRRSSSRMSEERYSRRESTYYTDAGPDSPHRGGRRYSRER